MISTRLLALVTLGALPALAGCPIANDSLWDDDGPDAVAVVPRSQVANVDDAWDASFYATNGGVIGEVLAVCGYDFNRVASANRVVVDGYDCRVLNYYEIDSGARFGALYFVLSNNVPVGNQRRLNVIVSGDDSDRRPFLDVHRMAYATPTSGTTVVASDLSINAPAWVNAYDFSVSSNPDTFVLSPDGQYAYYTSGTTLSCVLLASGQTVITAASYFNGNVGPLAISRDGKVLVAGVFPPSPGVPELAVVDTSFVEGMTLTVSPFSGGITVTDGGNIPAFAAATTVGLGGAFPGTMVFNSTSAKMYVTLSSAVTREYAVSGTTLTFGQDFSMSSAAPFGVTITPDDSRLLVTDISSNNQVIPVNLGTSTVETALSGGTTPLTPVITTDGKRGVVVNVGGTDYSLYDIATSGVSAHSPSTLSLGNPPGEIALSPDGPIGLAGASNLVCCIDGNRLQFIKYDAGTGALALAGFTTGPFANSLKKVAVVPAR